MEKTEILARVDHTALKSTATWEDIRLLCEEAVEYKTASVCIPPSYLKRARAAFPQLNLCTVIGFPLGANTSKVKAYETKMAIEEGADEVDMVINIGALKAGDMDTVYQDIQAVVDASQGHCVKVIIETCLLTDEEKVLACQQAMKAKATFVKTSTGFSTGGATVHDVALMKQTVGDHCEVKASGGVKTFEDMEAMVNAGASRIGTSSGISLMNHE